MDAREARRYRKRDRQHSEHCFKCGRPKREGNFVLCCTDVQHCACAMIPDKGL